MGRPPRFAPRSPASESSLRLHVTSALAACPPTLAIAACLRQAVGTRGGSTIAILPTPNAARLGISRMISKQLLEMLVCPETRQSLSPAPQSLIERLNRAIAARSLRNQSGQVVENPLVAGLVQGWVDALSDHRRHSDHAVDRGDRGRPASQRPESELAVWDSIPR